MPTLNSAPQEQPWLVKLLLKIAKRLGIDVEGGEGGVGGAGGAGGINFGDVLKKLKGKQIETKEKQKEGLEKQKEGPKKQIGKQKVKGRTLRKKHKLTPEERAKFEKLKEEVAKALSKLKKVQPQKSNEAPPPKEKDQQVKPEQQTEMKKGGLKRAMTETHVTITEYSPTHNKFEKQYTETTRSKTVPTGKLVSSKNEQEGPKIGETMKVPATQQSKSAPTKGVNPNIKPPPTGRKKQNKTLLRKI